MQFEDLDEPTTRRLISRLLSSPTLQDEKEASGTGVMGSLRSIFSVLARIGEHLRPSRRSTPRLPFANACHLQYDGAPALPGRTWDISFAGVTVVLSGSHQVPSQPCVLTIENVELNVTPIESIEQDEETLVRFQINAITKGEPTWQS